MAPFAITQFDIYVLKLNADNAKLIAITLAFLLCIAGLGYYAEQSNIGSILAFYVPAFALYAWSVHLGKQKHNISFLLYIAILARVILLFAFPNLSDDIYRFIWDGNLWLAGENPFDQLPTYWLAQGNVPGLDQALFAQLNSPEYFTIYPPICQLIFTIGTWLSPDSYWGASLVMKLFLLAFEIGSIFLIRSLLLKLNLPEGNVLLYALNPLVIIELVGNLHFEAAMVFFFLLSCFLLWQKKDGLAGLAMAGSIAVKLLPLMLLPFLIRLLGWQRALKFFGLVFLASVLFFMPFISDVFLANFGTSLDLYFQKFEFNASIYYLARAVGEWISGFNLIKYLGPSLALITMTSILVLAKFSKTKDYNVFFSLAALAFCIYLFFSTTIHPWYLSLPLALCCFTNFRFVYAWSFLIVGTYMNYSFVPYHEQLWWVIIEYSLVFALLYWEWKKIDTSSWLGLADSKG